MGGESSVEVDSLISLFRALWLGINSGLFSCIFFAQGLINYLYRTHLNHISNHGDMNVYLFNKNPLHSDRN